MYFNLAGTVIRHPIIFKPGMKLFTRRPMHRRGEPGSAAPKNRGDGE